MAKEKIKLLDGNIYEIDDIIYRRNLFQIVFADGVNVEPLLLDPSVFDSITILTRGGDIAGIYTGYSTIYKRDDNDVTLSNDGSVYIESEDPVEPPIIDPDPSGEEPIDPPEDDGESTQPPSLDEVKANKIAELSQICNNQITFGVDIDIDGEFQHFSYKEEDQVNIKDAFDLAVQTGMAVPYHADNGNCTLYEAEDVIKLYITEKMNLTHHQTYFNQLKMYVMSLDDVDTIKNVNYGDELTGQYLETYNTMMGQGFDIISTLLNNMKEKGSQQDTVSNTPDPIPLDPVDTSNDEIFMTPAPHEGNDCTTYDEAPTFIPVPPMPVDDIIIPDLDEDIPEDGSDE